MTEEGLKFLNTFFMKTKCEIDKVTISLEERPSFDINTEDYRFRVNISEVIDEIDIRYRDVSIEDHHGQIKHQKPHLQFKLHADKIGYIHIFLPITDVKEYKKYILSFIDIIGSILIGLDNKEKKLQTTFMIVDSFKQIKGMGDYIKNVVCELHKKNKLTIETLDKKEKLIDYDDIQKIKKVNQISPFFEKI